MMKITTVGVDLAKVTFTVHSVDEHGKAAPHKDGAPRKTVGAVRASAAVCGGAEACSGAQH